MNLHEKISSRLDVLEYLARQVGETWGHDAGWRGYLRAIRQEGGGVALTEQAEWFAAENSPAAVLRQVAEDREVLKRHANRTYGGYQIACHPGAVPFEACPELASLARRLGVDVAS